MVTEGEGVPRPPLTPDQLADLHGDVLPADVADRMRTAVADDAGARDTLAALDRVRAELGALRDDRTPPPPAPADVMARINAALAAEATPEPAGPRAIAEPVSPMPVRRRNPVRFAAAAAAALVVLALAAIGIDRLTTDEIVPPDPDTPVLAEPATPVQLGDDLNPTVALSMLGRTDSTGLPDPATRAGCLRANGFEPSTPVLGSSPVRLRGIAGVLMLFAGPRPPQITALVVGPSCSADDPATLARADIG